MRILVIGANGMIGSAMIRVLAENVNWEIFGTIRSTTYKHHFTNFISKNLLSDVDRFKPGSYCRSLVNISSRIS